MLPGRIESLRLYPVFVAQFSLTPVKSVIFD